MLWKNFLGMLHRSYRKENNARLDELISILHLNDYQKLTKTKLTQSWVFLNHTMRKRDRKKTTWHICSGHSWNCFFKFGKWTYQKSLIEFRVVWCDDNTYHYTIKVDEIIYIRHLMNLIKERYYFVNVNEERISKFVYTI